jgi:hypothetical protein
MDRVPGAATFTYLDDIGAAVRAQDGSGIITGLGAELSLDADMLYAADLLRRGHWLRVALDALRFRSYAAYEPASRLGRARYFLKTALAPPGSGLRRRRQPRPPRWLHPSRHEFYRSRAAQRFPTPPSEPYARAEKVDRLRYLGSTPYGNLDQLCQRRGLEAYHPFFHRGIFDLGFRTPPRALTDGMHAKQLLRTTARLALGGQEPPWPLHKTVFDAAIAEDPALLTELGPPQRWRLVQTEILDPEHARQLVERASQGQAVRPFDSALAIAERYLRRYG